VAHWLVQSIGMAELFAHKVLADLVRKGLSIRNLFFCRPSEMLIQVLAWPNPIGQHSRHYEILSGDEEVRIPLWKSNDRAAPAPQVQPHL
jgi:hypothetical protein